jgi:DNA-binding NarL/FixJ family response regulator
LIFHDADRNHVFCTSRLAGGLLLMRIVIVEDHLMFREVLRKVCVAELKHEVVAEAGDGSRAIEIVGETRPDLVLLDLHLPRLDGFAVVESIRRIHPTVRVLVLSSHCDEYTVYRAERARVQGFVDKNTNSVETLKAAITAIADGGHWFSEAYLREKSARHKDPRSFDRILSEHERTILGMIGEPLTDIEIAHRLEIAVETAQKHRSKIMRKLGLTTTAEAARYARAHGFTLSAQRADDGALLP